MLHKVRSLLTFLLLNQVLQAPKHIHKNNSTCCSCFRCGTSKWILWKKQMKPISMNMLLMHSVSAFCGVPDMSLNHVYSFCLQTTQHYIFYSCKLVGYHHSFYETGLFLKTCHVICYPCYLLPFPGILTPMILDWFS